MKRLAVFLIIAGLLATMLAGCAAYDQSPAGDYYAEADYSTASDTAQYDRGYAEEQGAAAPAEMPAAESAVDDAVSGGGGAALDYEGSMLTPGVNRKVIFSGYLSIQTTSFDEDHDRIKAALAEVGGYVENSSVSGTKPESWNAAGRTARFTLRVPSKQFDPFIESLKGLGETLSISTNGQDISLQYFDNETRLKTLRTREGRLIELLEQAKGLEDIIKLEQELANVAYEIQMLEIELRNYDSLIDYSTISIELYEVNQVERVTPSKEDLGTRIQSGFYSVLNVLAEIGESLLIFFLAGSPVLIPLALIGVLVIVLVRRNKKKKAQKPGGGV